MVATSTHSYLIIYLELNKSQTSVRSCYTSHIWSAQQHMCAVVTILGSRDRTFPSLKKNLLHWSTRILVLISSIIMTRLILERVTVSQGSGSPDRCGREVATLWDGWLRAVSSGENQILVRIKRQRNHSGKSWICRDWWTLKGFLELRRIRD